jgi:serine protease
MRTSTLLLALALVGLGAPGSAAPGSSNHTGRYIIRLKETPPPPRLLRIRDHLEGQYRKGGKVSPYLVVTPRARRFVLPAPLKTLVKYVEPEIWMYSIRPAQVMAFRAHGVSRRTRRSIGEPASGTSAQAPARQQIPPQPSIPNDTYWSHQWGMMDQGVGIRLPLARRYSRGANVTVGIVDSGIRQGLSDLAGTRFLPPYNAITGRVGGTDDNGHGSHVAGTIAQATDNRMGTAGTAPAAKILSVKALDLNGRGTNFTIGAAIRYAVDQGCSIINLSVGGSPSQTLKDAVAYATSKNVLLVCSSGNGGNASITYPAAYSETLSVGAIEENGSRAAFSQYGPGLGIVAPGVQILQQTFNKKGTGYFWFSGTSMAAPMVTGVAALVKSLRPSITRPELKLLLMGTATDLGPKGVDVQYGAGCVNAAAACERAAGPGGSPQPPGPGPPVPVPEPPIPVPPPDPGADAVVAEVLSIVNNERRAAGAGVLILHPYLLLAATTHAADMRARNQMTHTGSDGSTPGQRIARTGYQAINWGENVAAGYPTAQSVMRAWMASPGHRANILNPAFKEIGIAKDGAYWVQVFGTRRGQ